MSRTSAAAAKALTSSNHFELFGLPQRFSIDLPTLEKAYREIQSQVHPDRFAHAGDAERRASLQWTTRVNEAYRALRSPVKRASHILALHDVDVAFETNTAMPPEFLMQQMALREALEEAKTPSDLTRLEEWLSAERAGLEAGIGEAIDAHADYAAAAELVRKLRFLEKLGEEIDAAHERLA